MKCPQCGKEVADNYNFCPSCRCKLNKSESASVMMSSKAAYSTESSIRMSAHSDGSMGDSISPSISVTKNKAIWRVMQGEVCHHINEEEFAQYDSLQGIIIEQGVTAIIVVDGIVECTLSGGVYNFVSDRELDLLMRERKVEEKKGFFTKVKSFFARLFTSKKTEDGKQIVADANRKDVILNKLMSNVNVAVYLMLDREFPIMFGAAPDESGKPHFIPMNIRARNMDAKACATLALKITDPQQFIVQYMAGRRSMLLGELQQNVMPYFARIVRDEMQQTDISENGVPAEAIIRIEQRITALKEAFHGFVVTRVIDINCQSEAFERFRQLSQEMYCSEKELEYLRRTNDFKNRLATVENEQKIAQAQNDLGIMKALEDINKDKTLYEEELQKFYRLVSRQRRIAEAKDEAEIEKALSDIEKTKLLDADEMDALRTELLTKKTSRDNVNEVMRMESLATTEKRRIELSEELYSKTHAAERVHLEDEMEMEDIKRTHKRKVETEDVRHDTDMMEEAFRRQRMTDDYKDSRWDKEREHSLKTEYDKINLRQDERMVDININKARMEQELAKARGFQEIGLSGLERMEAMKRQKADEEHRHKMEETGQALEHERHKIDTDASLEAKRIDAQVNMESKRLDVEKDYSADQLAAARLDAEGAKEALSSRKETEMLKQQYEQRRQDEERRRQEEERRRREEREDRERLSSKEERLMNKLIDAMSGANKNTQEQDQRNYDRLERIATHRSDEQVNNERRRTEDMASMKEEYREDARHAQERIDENQKQSLNFTSRVSVADRQPTANGQAKKSNKVECPSCHQMIEPGLFCPYCGTEIEK